MFTQSRFNLLKIAAAALAAASLAACGGGGGSGGGSKKPVGSISVSDTVAVDDVITVRFQDCRSTAFNAKLDGIDVTPLFTLDKSDKNKACNARASVYALQGILGEKAQAEGSSKLLVKVQGRTDIDKSFKFKAWPDFALSYPAYSEVIEGDVFNALLSTNGGLTVSSGSGVSAVTEKTFKIDSEYPIAVTAEAQNGLKNKFSLAKSGEKITDSTVLQLPVNMNENHVVSDWIQSYLAAKGLEVNSVAITFASNCDDNNLCPTIKINNIEDYELSIKAVSTSTGFTFEAEVSDTSLAADISEALKEIVEALGSVLLKDSTNDSGITNKVQGVELVKPAFISVDRSIVHDSYPQVPASYFAQGPDNVKSSLANNNLFYLATTSNEINQRLLVETLLMQVEPDGHGIKGEVPLCDGNNCTLRDELIKLATPPAEAMAKSIGLISTTQARKLVENILTKQQKIVYKVEPREAPPYVRFLDKQLELSVYNVFFELALSEEINATTVCSKVFTGVLLSGCKGELPSGKYMLQLGDAMLKQRTLVKGGEIVISDLIETSIHLNKELPVVNNFVLSDKPAVAWAMGLNLAGSGEPKPGSKIGALSSQDVLPVLFGALGQLPFDEVSNFKLADLTQSGAEIKVDCEADASDVLEAFIGESGKQLSFKDSDLELGATSTDSDTKEAKHLILSGDIIKTPSGTTPDISIICE